MDQSNRLLIRLGKLDKSDASTDIVFSSTNLSRFYFPGRGVIPSFIIHIIAVSALFFSSLLRAFILPPPPPDQVVFIDLQDPRTVMYLPPLQGNEPRPAATTRARVEDEQPAPQASSEGLSYPGLQPILSAPPEPTNRIQTILRPKLENPETLIPPLPVPNIVQTENTPMVVQLPELKLAGPERLQEDAMTSLADGIPDPLFAPSEDFPELEIPSLLSAGGPEPEMVLPETETAPIERMRSAVRKPAVNDRNASADAPSTGFPELDVPELLRIEGTEQEMVLPAPQRAPLERMKPSMQNPPVNAAENRTIAPASSFPKVEIPDLLRTSGSGSEMALPQSVQAPREPMQIPRPKIPANPPDAPHSAPSSNFPKMKLPSLVRAGAESEMPLPQSAQAPREPMQIPRPKIAPNMPDTAYTPPQAAPPKTGMPKMLKVSPPERKSGPGEASTTRVQENTLSAGEGERILNLTPMPALPPFQIEIPKGEARGSFEISPEPNLASPSMDAGVRPEKASGDNPGILPANADAPQNAAATANTEDEFQEPFFNAPTGNGEDAFDGITIIDGSEQPRDEMNAPFLTPVENSIEGIEIIGGVREPGNASPFPQVKHPPPPIQTEYHLSIITTEQSGSVLGSKDYFKNTLYTVYLDMRETIQEAEQQWIFEFGLLDDVEINPVIALDFDNYTKGLLPPFPLRKKRPTFPEALVRKDYVRMILVSGIINAEGRMEQLSIEDSPDGKLTEDLLEALAAWIFRPTRLNGQPVAVKFMMGVPF